MHSSSVKNIIITGPESTGKTRLSQELAVHYTGTFIPEFARTYIESLERDYTFEDVEIIAEQQWEGFRKVNKQASEINFFDTFLEISKVWFLWVYDKYPEWIDIKLKDAEIDLFLVCDTDLPWVADNVRENGGETRKRLFREYVNIIEELNVPYKVVTGTGCNRLDCAINHIQTIL